MRHENRIQDLCKTTENTWRSQRGENDLFHQNLANQSGILHELIAKMHRFEDMQRQTHESSGQCESSPSIRVVSSTTSAGMNNLGEDQATSLSSIIATNKTVGIGSMTCISVKLQQPQEPYCSIRCSCACHASYKSRSPQIFDSIIGGFFIGYTCIPFFTPRCTMSSCAKLPCINFVVTYFFPQWFSSRVLTAILKHSQYNDLKFCLRVYKWRSDSVPVSTHIIQGNLSAIKSLLVKRQMSPFEIGTLSRRSVLHVSRLSYSSSFRCETYF